MKTRVSLFLVAEKSLFFNSYSLYWRFLLSRYHFYFSQKEQIKIPILRMDKGSIQCYDGNGLFSQDRCHPS